MQFDARKIKTHVRNILNQEFYWRQYFAAAEAPVIEMTYENVTRDVDGAIQALARQKLAGKVPVSGQDADLAAVRRVAEGTQAMTVYKPIKEIAATAAEMAVDFVKGTTPKFNTKLNNGKKDVDTVLLTPTLLTKDNLDSTVVKDGFYTHQQIFGK